MAKPPFRLIIGVGQPDRSNLHRSIDFRTSHERGEFETDIDQPAFSISRANRYIQENYGPNFELFLLNGNRERRRSRRRT